MNKHGTIPDTDEAWESGELGRRDAEHAQKLPDDPTTEALIDSALDLQPISIRLEKSLIEDFKLIAQMTGLGYQPLMRQVLKRFADCEKKRILREAAANMKADAKPARASASESRPKTKKAA